MTRNLEAIAFEPNNLARRRIAQQHHLMHAKIEENLRPDAVFDEPLLANLLWLFVAIKPRRDRVSPALADQHDHTAALASNDVHGLVHERLAMAACAQNIVERVCGMNAGEHRS